MQTSQTLHVVIIQSPISWENPKVNRAYFKAKIDSVENHTDLVILPEMFTTGFSMNASNLSESMIGETVLWMQKLALEKQIAITGSVIIKEDQNYYNRLIFVHPSGKTEYYNKRHSFTLAKEEETYTSGTNKLIVNYKGWKICPLICYDLRFPVWSRNTENYDLLIYTANWPEKRIYAWDHLLKARAIENMTYTIGVNRTGIDGSDFKYNGHSIGLDALGTPLSEENNTSETLIQISLNKKHQNSIREQFNFLNDKDSFTVFT